ncbi:hypothetical protein EIA29_25945, partial [Escherichia coli]
MQPTTTSGNIITQSIIFSFRISQLLRVFSIEYISSTLALLHVSNGGGRLLQLTDFFITLF